MKPIRLAGILFILLVGFLVWEVIFSAQRYGLPKFNLTPQPVAGSCKILEEKYCTQGKLVKWKNIEGNDVSFIGFNLSKGVKIFNPVDGYIGKTVLNKSSQLKGSYGSIDDSKDPNIKYGLVGDIKFSNMSSQKVTSGIILGEIDNTGAKNLGNFNLLISINRFDKIKNKYISAEDILKNYFPKL